MKRACRVASLVLTALGKPDTMDNGTTSPGFGGTFFCHPDRFHGVWCSAASWSLGGSLDQQACISTLLETFSLASAGLFSEVRAAHAARVETLAKMAHGNRAPSGMDGLRTERAGGGTRPRSRLGLR